MQTLTLVQYGTTPELPNYSPFCVKAEVLLKMAGLPYEIEELNDPTKTPKGKLPMLRDGEELIPDSEFILYYLQDEKGIDFDTHLSDKEKAQAHAFAKMIDERTYWALVHDRWIDPEHWPKIREFWFGDMPFFLKPIITPMIQKSVKKNLHGHGIGRHSFEEIAKLASKDIKAIADQLADQNFMFGDKPCTADASTYGFLVSLLHAPLPSKTIRILENYPALKDYVKRCNEFWYPGKYN